MIGYEFVSDTQDEIFRKMEKTLRSLTDEINGNDFVSNLLVLGHLLCLSRLI